MLLISEETNDKSGVSGPGAMAIPQAPLVLRRMVAWEQGLFIPQSINRYGLNT